MAGERPRAVSPSLAEALRFVASRPDSHVAVSDVPASEIPQNGHRRGREVPSTPPVYVRLTPTDQETGGAAIATLWKETFRSVGFLGSGDVGNIAEAGLDPLAPAWSRARQTEKGSTPIN